MTQANRFAELGYYTAPGHVHNAKDVGEEVRVGDALGLGSVWISERLNTKEAGVLCGLAAANTSHMGIATGLISNLTIRNPVAVAAMASTMALLTDNRFALGMGRGVGPLADATGTPRLNFKIMEDYIGILRRLWRGETVNYDGPVGRLTGLKLGAAIAPPPVICAAMGDKTCEWAGRVCDGVLFNSLWTPEATAHSVKVVRQAAEKAGRDPASVKIWAVQVTASDVSEEEMLRTIIRRMNTYLLFGEMMDFLCRMNGWNPADVKRLQTELSKFDRNAMVEGGLLGDEATTRSLDDLRKMRDFYPRDWIYRGNAVGSADAVAKATLERFEAGVDGVLFHGTQPQHLESLLKIWPAHRPPGRFDGRSVNPGLS
ncbi:MAG: TIGR03857 family LLM class F420-dependent oxidoreductase [Caulobacterales bacterium]